MGQFMSNNRSDIVLASFRGYFWIVKEVSFPVSDKTPIFHSARTEIRNSNHILFGKWIINVEKFLVEFQRFRTDFFGEIHLENRVTVTITKIY